jgi:hypothetical protein
MKPQFPEFDPVTDSIDLALVECAKIVIEAAAKHNGGSYVDGAGACEWVPLLDALGRFATTIKSTGETAPIFQLHEQTQFKQEEPNAADDL